MALDPKTLVGWCAPNRRLQDIEGGRAAFWDRMKLSGTKNVVLLFPDHSPEDAKMARARGIRVFVRLPNEGYPTVADTYEVLNAFAPYVNVVILGNEPDVSGVDAVMMLQLAKHLDALEHIADECNYLAVRMGVQLCAPGWHSTAEPLDPANGGAALRFWNVYSRFQAIAVHCYGSVNLDGQLARAARWQKSFKKPTYITEAGIAARDLIGTPPNPDHYDASQPIKATRYRDFVRAAAVQNVRAVTFFIDRGSTPEWGTFNSNGKYDPHGVNSYWLDDKVLPILAEA